MSRNLLSEILGQAERRRCRNWRCTCAEQVAASIVATATPLGQTTAVLLDEPSYYRGKGEAAFQI